MIAKIIECAPEDVGCAARTEHYFYDIDNRLIRVEDAVGALIARYGYDPFGRRLWKEANGTRMYFFYADEGLIAEYAADGTQIKSYGYKPGATFTTDPLWQQQNGQHYFYHNDHLGTPQKLTDQAGAVVWSATYSAFGRAVVEVALVENNLRFPGQYYDGETGLHYNYHRYYDPEVGRYVRVDPIGIEGGVNFYVYTENNPINFIDPLGLDRYEICDDLPPGQKEACKQTVDYACKGEKRSLCCLKDRQDCYDKLDLETCPSEDLELCNDKYTWCMAGG